MIKKEHTCVTRNEIWPIVSTSPTAEEQFVFVMSDRLGFVVAPCI